MALSARRRMPCAVRADLVNLYCFGPRSDIGHRKGSAADRAPSPEQGVAALALRDELLVVDF